MRLGPGPSLDVLPAYHDDVVTRDMSVGLGFEIRFSQDLVRRIAFTGDTGFYPRLHENGQPSYYDPKTKNNPKLDTNENKALRAAKPADGKNKDRPYLFNKKRINVADRNRMAEDFFNLYYNHKLPIHKT